MTVVLAKIDVVCFLYFSLAYSKLRHVGWPRDRPSGRPSWPSDCPLCIASYIYVEETTLDKGGGTKLPGAQSTCGLVKAIRNRIAVARSGTELLRSGERSPFSEPFNSRLCSETAHTKQNGMRYTYVGIRGMATSVLPHSVVLLLLI